MRAAGYDYVYLDRKYWENMNPKYQGLLEGACVKLVKQYEWEGPPYDFRRLLDIRGCGS